MPHSLEAERSVLGCMLIDGEAAYLAQESLAPEDFYSAAHREIYSAMQAVHAARKPIDLVTVADEIYRRGTMEGIGGLAYLTELSQFVPTTVNASAYIRIVEEKSTLRRLIDACARITQESYSATAGYARDPGYERKVIYDISMKRSGEALRHINPALLTVYDNIEQLYVTKGAVSGVPTGYEALDNLTHGAARRRVCAYRRAPFDGNNVLCHEYR
jgi:replicative DNA helicase